VLPCPLAHSVPGHAAAEVAWVGRKGPEDQEWELLEPFLPSLPRAILGQAKQGGKWFSAHLSSYTQGLVTQPNCEVNNWKNEKN
jgi:hypothetical protein